MGRRKTKNGPSSEHWRAERIHEENEKIEAVFADVKMGKISNEDAMKMLGVNFLNMKCSTWEEALLIEIESIAKSFFEAVFYSGEDHDEAFRDEEDGESNNPIISLLKEAEDNALEKLGKELLKCILDDMKVELLGEIISEFENEGKLSAGERKKEEVYSWKVDSADEETESQFEKLILPVMLSYWEGDKRYAHTLETHKIAKKFCDRWPVEVKAIQVAKSPFYFEGIHSIVEKNCDLDKFEPSVFALPYIEGVQDARGYTEKLKERIENTAVFIRCISNMTSNDLVNKSYCLQYLNRENGCIDEMLLWYLREYEEEPSHPLLAPLEIEEQLKEKTSCIWENELRWLWKIDGIKTKTFIMENLTESGLVIEKEREEEFKKYVENFNKLILMMNEGAKTRLKKAAKCLTCVELFKQLVQEEPLEGILRGLDEAAEDWLVFLNVDIDRKYECSTGKMVHGLKDYWAIYQENYSMRKEKKDRRACK